MLKIFKFETFNKWFIRITWIINTMFSEWKEQFDKNRRIADRCLLLSDANMGNVAGMLPIIPVLAFSQAISSIRDYIHFQTSQLNKIEKAKYCETKCLFKKHSNLSKPVIMTGVVYIPKYVFCRQLIYLCRLVIKKQSILR